MKERSLIFSGPMVRALLDGRKTQTRRIVKPQPPAWATWVNARQHLNHESQWVPSHLFAWSEEQTPGEPLKKLRRWPNKNGDEYSIPCPYGAPGDRLWVKEKWAYFGGDEYLYQQERSAVGYAASLTHLESPPGGKWRSTLFMPRWASRITLEVTRVRVERLQDISEEDARAEGVQPFFEEFSCFSRDQRLTSGELAADAEHRASFAVLWDEINADRATWKSNPWVWAVDFKRVQP